MRATIVVAGNDGAGSAGAIAAWLAATEGLRRAAFVEGLTAAADLPADVPATRLAAGCVCCVGQAPLRVGITRAVRSARPQALLLVLSGGAHVPRVRALLADGSLGVRFEVEAEVEPGAAPGPETLMSQLQTSRANGIDIAWRTDGAGAESGAPWVVLSHSLAADHRMWDPQIDALARYRILRFDTRGHGATSVPPGDYTMDDLAGDALALLDACGVRRCHFVGMSMGGMIGQQLALRAPGRVLSLTLADTSSRYPPAARPMWDERIALVRARGMDAVAPGTLERWFTPAFREREPDTVARIGAQIRATPVAGFIGCAHAISHIDLTARLPAIRCPTLVIVGADDPSTPVEMSEEIVRAIEGSQLEVLADAAHLSSVEQAGRFNELLRTFLGSVRS